MKKIYYEKQGRKYVPVAEYDSDLLDSYPKGVTLVVCRPGSTSRRYHIDPDWAPLIAAGLYAEDAIVTAVVKATEVRPTRQPITEAERDAWQHLIDVWGEEARSLVRPAAADVARAGVEALQKEAQSLLTHPMIKDAYDKFLLTVELCRKKDAVD